ncbi:MAG: molybdopterin oxidoreductase, iron-sulfur binding subunit [Bacteroidetes bacterium]|nr:MAG: molybdopterin oxidoreductase, iron-sulfur binding subunit [Bacteroidota bacterium]
MGNEKKYWRGIGQFADEQAYAQAHQNEFAEHVPVDQFLGDNSAMQDAGTSRRDFLKFLGFSAAAVTLAACETPVMNAIPYVVRPDEIIPGEANWYASTFFDGNDYCSVLVKTREGRPIKLEGNAMSKVTGGGVNARAHASVLSLYDSGRACGPMKRTGDKWSDPMSWTDADNAIGKALGGKTVAIVTSTITSPSTLAVIREFKAKHIVYDAISYSGIAKAHAGTFGASVIPTYHFDKADVIVSLGADFLANWLSPIEHSRQYAMGRKVSKDKMKMSRHFQFEAIMSLTGANADERFPVKPSKLGKIALEMLSGTSSDAGVKKAIDALKGAQGKALVVCGSNDPAIQRVVCEINKNLGAYESKIIDIDIPDNTHQGDDETFAKFVKEEMSGMGAVIFYGCNPAYTAPKSLGFAEKLSKVPVKISFADRADETASLCDWICPDSHYLESWNDHNPRKGEYSTQQPAIRPIFNTRQAQDTLLKWSGNNNSYYIYMQNTWKVLFNNVADHSSFWNQSVHDGIISLPTGSAPEIPAADSLAVNKPAAKPEPAKDEAPVEAPVTTGNGITLDEAKSAIAGIKEATLELVVFQSTAMGNGSQSNNPWLQEMPDPITKITWDNVVTMHPMDVKANKLFGLLEGEGEDITVRFDQMEDQLDIVTVSANGHDMKLPVWVQPGQARGTIGIAMGYGRSDSFGNTSKGVGANAFPALGMTSGKTMSYEGIEAKITPTEEKHWIACTQTHGTMMGRNEHIIQEVTIAEYVSKKGQVSESEMLHTYAGEKRAEEVNLWEDHDRPGHQWAMAIDLNACTGCGACVVSCNAENNVHVVGKDEVRRSREMHWIRIDRYYSSDTTPADSDKYGTKELYRLMESPTFDNPKVMFQPMMCQHCNHAPCETVCPVLATNHSSEGLNQMAYNRCVGTRYCANNCPYKVRRFNWFNYVGYHRPMEGINQNPGHNPNPIADDYGRMVLNPDVVVRSRGVMEKCSMCQQRIQAGKLEAKKAGKALDDGAIQTACSQSCPTNAIVFGDINDETSLIAQMLHDGRKFEVMEQVGARPSVFYMTKVWNREEEAGPEKAKGGHGEEKKEAAHH